MAAAVASLCISELHYAAVAANTGPPNGRPQRDAFQPRRLSSASPRGVAVQADVLDARTAMCACASAAMQPHAITAKRMGVGACLWEGELLLAAYLGEHV